MRFWLTGINFRHSSHKENIWKTFQVDYLKGRRTDESTGTIFLQNILLYFQTALTVPPQIGHTAEYVKLSLSV
jgi:hypothetical protein